MRILVANDDGVHFQGLWTLVEALTPCHQVTVVAPDREQSGVGPALSLHHALRAHPVTSPIAGVCAYAVQGTPGDCVILGLGALAQDAELVIAGINEGANVGDDVFISGTVGAALHGYFRGLPAIAISVTAPHSTHYRPAAHVAARLVESFASGQMPRRTLLNVNVPDLPAGEIKGVVLARRAHRRYDDLIQEAKDDRGKTLYWIVRRRPAGEPEEGTDIWAIRNGNISIVSLESDMIRSNSCSQLEALCETLLEGLRRREATIG